MNATIEHEKSPSEKAWDTARQKAISEYEARFHDVIPTTLTNSAGSSGSKSLGIKITLKPNGK